LRARSQSTRGGAQSDFVSPIREHGGEPNRCDEDGEGDAKGGRGGEGASSAGEGGAPSEINAGLNPANTLRGRRPGAHLNEELLDVRGLAEGLNEPENNPDA
jgi:hypothetical protein